MKYLKWKPLAAVLVIWLLLPSIWYSSPFTGTVLDGEGRPVKDAMVMVGWGFRVSHDGGVLPYVLREAKTDINGKFTIERWGPMLGPGYFSVITYDDPRIDVMHDQYMPATILPDRKLFPVRTRRFINGTPESVIVIQVARPDISDSGKNRKAVADYISDLYQHYQTDVPPCFWRPASNFVERIRFFEQKYDVPIKRFFLIDTTC